MTGALARGFLAVVPPPAVLDALEDRVAPLRVASPAASVGLRWTHREQWHLTVRFLGPVPDVDRLVGGLRDLACGGGFELALGGAGAFANERRATVLWVGVGADHAPLVQLAETVETVVTRLGFAPDPRPFHGHLTIARLARPRPVRALVEAFGPATVGGPWPVRHLVLFESHTRPDGARYTERARLGLGE